MSAAVADESTLQRFDSVRDEIARLISNETTLQNKIKQLEADLDVYKRIFGDTITEKKRLEDENDVLKQNLEKQREASEKQSQASRVVVLLDGDGAIFVPQIIALGQAGGHKAASQLSNSIKEYIRSFDESRQFQLSVYHSAKFRLDDFVTGFNQATERFMMVDVGNGKEAADSKIKAFLEDEARLPQTYKIIFGGCHDNGYVNTIRSHITSGFKDKFILLKSYTEHAGGFDDLELPVHSIPGLFITQKLVTPFQSQSSLAPSGSLSPPFNETTILDALSPRAAPFDVPQMPLGPGHQDRNYPSPTLYPILLRATEHRLTVGSETASDHGNVTEGSYSTPQSGGLRYLEPNLPLSKQNPPPCTVFYLMNACKYRAGCKYSHDYILQPEHYTELKIIAKKAPCPAINKNQNCSWGDRCYYGHTCPMGMKCYFFKKGRCKFVGAEMHLVKTGNSSNAVNQCA